MKIDASEDQVDLDHHDIEAGEQLDFPSCHLGWNSKLAGADDEELLQDLDGEAACIRLPQLLKELPGCDELRGLPEHAGE